ncbi:MAG TPA: CARDB domain-containing protein [Candidatus Bipolaricaulis anaerobius]|nr:CARDB domain-containing protein [Candidatus Bipolaricaulis anaerobius]
MALILAFGCAGLGQVEIVALDADRAAWDAVVAQARGAGLAATVKDYNEAALYNQVYLLVGIGMARFDVAQALTTWAPNVAARFADLTPYASQLQAAGLEIYRYGGRAIGVVLPWRAESFAGVSARSTRVKESVQLLTYLPAGGTRAPEATRVGVPLSIGPVTITKTEKRNPHVDGALETFVAATRQVVSTGVLTALTKVPAQARDALTKVAGMLGIPLSPAGDAVTLVIESKGGVAPLGVAVEPVSSPLGLTKVSVPLSQLESFLAQVGPGVYVRLPYTPHELAVTSQGASLVGASAFHSAGIRGLGVKVAVIDLGFSGLATSQAQGDLPYSVVTRDFTGTGIETGISHGTAVAEIVYDIAPDAQLYLVKIGNEVDLDNAVTYCISEGISIINHSLGWYNTNFYDGTGTIADIARRATSAGILWVQAAGNSGQKHYGATFTDGNSDGWHDTDITFAATAGQQIAFYLTWDAWPATGDDYDLYLFGPTGTLVASSTATQGGTEQPTERITTTAGSSGTYRVRIQKASGATRRLSVFSIVHDLTPAVSASSMPAPANAAEVLSVGAINWTNYTSGPIAPYSSRGPTGDGRAKPDLAAPDNVTTGVSYYSPFPGTSAAAPHVAGVAALLKAEAPTLNRSSLASRILSFCVPMGDPYAFGAGRLEARPQGPTAQADLIVDAITYSPTTPTLGSTVTFQVTVRNQGTASAGSFVVRLQGVGPSQDQSVASLAAGASVTRTFTLPLSTSPETFTATADANGQVSESDEANNTRPVTVTGPVARPDLVVDAITYSPPNPTLGSTITFQVTVRNQGSASAGSFVLRLQGAASYQDATVSSLAAGSSTMRTFTLPLSTSPETFTAIADANGQVSESDEANNTRPVTVTGPVARPDLVVDNVTYSPPNPTLGSTVTFQVTVRNQGSASAGSFVLRLQGVASYQDATVSSLAAGASTTRTFSLPLSTSPETFTATADANGQVSESDEANNARPVTITAAVPALAFTVATDKSTYAVGEPVRVTVALSRASYVYLIELDAAGRAVFIFPNRWEPSPQLPAGTTQLPRTTAYSYTTAEPAGPEQIVGFASDRVIPYFPTSYGTGFPILATNGALFLSQVRSWLAANVPSGSWAEASAPFTIILPTNQPPTASFTFSPANPLPNQWITFDGRGSSDPDGTITSWAWNFGDGATGTGSQIQKRYSSGGTYTVALTVTDNRGATATTTRTVTVGTPNQPPTASFTFSPANPDPGENVTFNASASSDPDGSIVTYSWSFGDGTTGTGMPITKAYTLVGVYVVTLTVTDNLGATGTTTRTIQVGTPPPPPPTLPGMPTIDRPGIYVWGDPENRWHVTVAGDAGWTSPRPFEVTLETRGTFANRVFTPAGPSPAITASGGITKLVWTGTIGSGWADLAFDLTGATSMQLTLYLDTDGDGVAKPASRPQSIVYLRSCKVNPPGGANPLIVSARPGASALLPSANFRVGFCSGRATWPDCTFIHYDIEYVESEAGCR